MRPILTLATACLILGACTTSSEPKARGAEKFADDPRLGAEVNRICFASSIDSFGSTTRDTFTVREGRDHYLVEVFPGCSPLEHALTIGMEARTGCLTRGDRVIVSDSIMPDSSDSPFSVQRCTVNAIYDWTPDAEEEVAEDAGDEEAAPAEDSEAADTDS
ncbi:MAG: hypothetical protein KDA53_17750 [Hyphomonas sp.]|nr:hypothetical protein [Hyphomonas sp.]